MSEAGIKREEISEIVMRYVLTELLPGEDPGALTSTTPLITGGIIDSIASLKLVGFLEERFRVQFEAREITVDCLDTVTLIVDTVAGKLARGT